MNTCLLIFAAVFAAVSSEAPLPFGPYPAPAPVYGPPKILEPIAPYPPAVPAPVYGPPPRIILPTPKIVSNYGYEVYTPKRVEILAPYPAPAPYAAPAPYPAPAPIIRSGPYPAPAPLIIKHVEPIVSTYNYEVPHYIPAPVVPAPVYGPPARIEVPIVPAPVYGPPARIEVPVAPAPVYGPPARIEVPVAPAPVYGPPPRIALPAPKPILTSYGYPVYTPQPIVKSVGPYPAPAPLVKIPEVPVAPHTEYGSPVF